MIVTVNPIEKRIDYTIHELTRSIFFDELDEWKQDGEYFFHFDYEKRDNFNSQKDWLEYMIQCYLDIDSHYDDNLITKIELEL